MFNLQIVRVDDKNKKEITQTPGFGFNNSKLTVYLDYVDTENAPPSEVISSKISTLYRELVIHKEINDLAEFFSSDGVYTDEVLAKLKAVNDLDPGLYNDIVGIIAVLLRTRDTNEEISFIKRMSNMIFEGTLAHFANAGIPVVSDEPDSSDEITFDDAEENDSEPSSDDEEVKEYEESSNDNESEDDSKEEN